MAGYGIPTALLGAYIGGKVIFAIDESLVEKIIFFMIPIGLLLSFMPKKGSNYQPSEKDIT